jgi:hypothetical protein
MASLSLNINQLFTFFLNSLFLIISNALHLLIHDFQQILVVKIIDQIDFVKNYNSQNIGLYYCLLIFENYKALLY